MIPENVQRKRSVTWLGLLDLGILHGEKEKVNYQTR